MYVSNAFRTDDETEIFEFIRRFGFATLVSNVSGRLFATHLPLLHDRAPGRFGVLLGHVARANEHWRAFEERQESLAVFLGSHGYISPAWYATQPAVPTWNYGAVHVYGVPRLLTETELAGFVDRLTETYESTTNPGTPYRVPPKFRDSLLGGIVGFVLEITSVEGKLKLSQNRS